MSLVLRVVIGLIAGLLLGVAIASSHSTWFARIPGWLEGRSRRLEQQYSEWINIVSALLHHYQNGLSVKCND